MKTVIISIIVLFTLLLFSCSHEVFPGSWQTTDVKIDSRLNEWEIPLRFYDSDTKLNYSITNDARNIYLCIRVTDMATQSKIMKAGMQLWIDTAGNKKHTIGIQFPLSIERKIKYGEQEGGDLSSMPDDQRAIAKERINFIASNKEMKLTGFKSPLNGFVPLHNENGLHAGIDWDANNTMVYEARIPFATFCKPVLTAADSTKIFNIGIFVNGIDISRPSENTSGNTMGSPMGYGPGGSMGSSNTMGGIGTANGSTAGSGKRYNALTETKNVWTRFRLAVPR